MLAMGGGLLVNGSRCWAEARPLVICTVADCSVVLSASVTVAPLSITTAVEAPSPLASFQVVAPAVSVTTGRGSVGTRGRALVLTVLSSVPALAVELMGRLVP